MTTGCRETGVEQTQYQYNDLSLLSSVPVLIALFYAGGFHFRTAPAMNQERACCLDVNLGITDLADRTNGIGQKIIHKAVDSAYTVPRKG
jgi:hypothetical protein